MKSMEKPIAKEISLSLNRKRGKFNLSIDGKSFEQNICEFLLTVSFMVGKDVEEHLLSTDSQYDTIKVPLTCAGTTLTLELAHFISLRAIYGHQMFCLQLEDLLMRHRITMS